MLRVLAACFTALESSLLELPSSRHYGYAEFSSAAPQAFTRGAVLTTLESVLGSSESSCAPRRGKDQDRHRRLKVANPARPDFWQAFIICILSGILSAFLNFGFAFGNELVGRRSCAGSEKLWRLGCLSTPSIAVDRRLRRKRRLPPYRLGRNRTWNRFRQAGTLNHLLLAALMACLRFVVTFSKGSELPSWVQPCRASAGLCPLHVRHHGERFRDPHWGMEGRRSQSDANQGIRLSYFGCCRSDLGNRQQYVT